MWTTSKVGSNDPEDIDQETQAFFRNIYKLEKQFADLPAPGALASQVKFCFDLYKNVIKGLFRNLFYNVFLPN